LLLVVFLVSFAPAEEEKVNWWTFEEAVKKATKKDKPIFIDVYTNWCGWCKVMDRNTFSQPDIIKRMNKDFYAVKFNAEQREVVKFNGKEYKFVANGRRGYHELAAALMNSRMAYPTVVFLVDKFSKAFPHAGYQKPESMNKLMDFYGGGHYKQPPAGQGAQN
jgi:uncharacterized protein YyaL (SSP411 family)